MNLHPLNVLDGLVIITIGWNIVRGFNKGFVEEIISISGLALSVLLAFKLSHPLANFLYSSPDLSQVLTAGFIIFTAVFLTFKYFAFYIEKSVNKTAFGIVNNLLGFLFGIVRGIAIASIIVFAVSILSPDGYLIKRSYIGGITVPVIDKALEFATGLIPENDRKMVEGNWKKARKYLLSNLKKWKGENSP